MMRSESTRALGQPSETNPIFGAETAAEAARVDVSVIAPIVAQDPDAAHKAGGSRRQGYFLAGG